MEMLYIGMQVFNTEEYTLNKELMLKKAMEILLCQANSIDEKEISTINAIYYRNINRGGGALIISPNGEMLFADPFYIGIDEHIEKFIAGERTVFEIIE